MANWLEMIRWNGETGEPGALQVIRPISASGSSAGGGNIVPPDDIADQLQTWLNAVDAFITGDWEKWIDDSIAFSESEGTRDLPAPIPPQLPDITDFISLPALIGQFGPWGLVIFVGIKIAKRLIEGWLEKKMNPGIGELQEILEDIRDALEKGLLFHDGSDESAAILRAGMLFEDVDGKHKGALDRGLIIEIWEGDPPVRKKISLLDLLNRSVEDLALVDALIDFGAFRCHIKGKMIEY